MQQHNINSKTIRLSKAISDSGFCSRRKAEELILEGKVKVNGIIVNNIPAFISENDSLSINETPIKMQQEAKIWAYNKPVGLITSHSRKEGKPIVFDDLAFAPGKHLISVGRLDVASEGLLLITNNGNIARIMELPSSKLERIYKVRSYGDIRALLSFLEQKKINQEEYSIFSDKIKYYFQNIKLISDDNFIKKNHWFEISIKEGKNREVRKIFAYFGLQVNRLIRIKYGPFLLGDLKPRQWRVENLKLLDNYLNLRSISI